MLGSTPPLLRKMDSSRFDQNPNIPARSVSAPAQLDPHLLFAYPVVVIQLQCASAFASSPGQGLTFKENLEDSLSTSATPGLRKMSSCSDFETESEGKGRTMSSLVKAVVDCCMSDEESPRRLEDVMESFQTDFIPADETYELAKDQTGCRLLQKRLEDSPYFCTLIFPQILPHVSELMVHPFGNYLCQKLIEIGSEPDLSDLISRSHPYLASISLNTHGTRVVQKLIEALCRSPLILRVLAAIRPQVVTLIKDSNGNHVVQRCLTLLQPSFNQFIYQAVAGNMVEIATHRHGCCVLQRCLDYSETDQKKLLINTILDNAVELVQDAYGNYAMQYVLDLNYADTNTRLARIFTLQVVALSKQKFSSNVIEKCLQQNEEGVQIAMITEIAKPQNLLEMLYDQYANYVVQRALTLAPSEMLTQMLTVPVTQDVKNGMDGLRRSQFGKRVYSKLAKKYPDLAPRYVM